MSFQFETLTDFLSMDGHGTYVWASYIVTAIALKILVWYPFSKQKESLVRIKRQQRIENADS